MSAPRPSDAAFVKRLTRYIKGRPVSEAFFEWQERTDDEHHIILFTDSDWATDTRARKSRSGGVLMIGRHTVAHWGKQQDRIALSTAEAELKSSCKGIAELIGLKNIWKFLTGRAPTLEHRIDASATEKFVQRQGNGTMKHLDIRELWVQEANLEYKIATVKIPRSENQQTFYAAHREAATSTTCSTI